MGVRDGAFVANPGGEKGSRDVNKIILNVGHFDVWDYGSNFFNVDVLFSNANEPANNSSGGSTESLWGVSWSVEPGQDFRLNTKFGPIRPSTSNSAVTPRRRTRSSRRTRNCWSSVRTSTSLLPAGFLNIGIHLSKEWNNNGIAGRNVPQLRRSPRI